jgi:hypothetical protein
MERKHMPQTNTSKLSTWILWAPIKFSIITFICLTIVGLLYTFITAKIYAPAPTPTQPIIWLCTITFIGCIAHMFYKLPRINFDRASFVATHNSQMLITSIFFILLTYIVINNATEIVLQLILLETKSQPTFVLLISAIAIFILYIFGILFSNIYAKIRRIQALNIPTWKIVCSMPFGFSALWTPGYILNTNDKTNNISIKLNWYKKLTDKIITHQSVLIAVFSVITMLSGFIYGLNSILLTFTLALIFGIWALNTGTKKFLNNIGGKYANWAIIINIVLIITFSLFYRITNNLQKQQQININSTEQSINL